MASKLSNHSLRGSNSDPAAADGNPKGETLGQTAFRGQARLEQLERLAKTARHVRQIAQQELAESRTSREVAEQRIATCERTLRKAEDEMARIRSELYRFQQQAGAEAGKYRSAEEFELAILLGKTARAENPSTENIAALELTPLPKSDKKKTTRRPKLAPFRSVTQEQHDSSHKTALRLGFGLLVVLGIIIGATLTYLALTTPSVKENVKSLATDPARLIDELTASGRGTKEQAKSIAATPLRQLGNLTAGDATNSESSPAAGAAVAPTGAMPTKGPAQQPIGNAMEPKSKPAAKTPSIKPHADSPQLRPQEAQPPNLSEKEQPDLAGAQ